MSKVNKEEKSWILYDWANSAYSMTITSTILPIYFKLVAEQGGMSSATSTALWGYTISIATFIFFHWINSNSIIGFCTRK